MRRIIRTEHFAYDSLDDMIHRGRRYGGGANVTIPLGDPIAEPLEMPVMSIELMEEWDDIADIIFCEFVEKYMREDD